MLRINMFLSGSRRADLEIAIIRNAANPGLVIDANDRNTPNTKLLIRLMAGSRLSGNDVLDVRAEASLDGASCAG